MSADGSTLAHMPIEPPTDEDREQLRAELLVDADLVRDYGWDEGWSAGQIAGVRAVLGEPGALDEAVISWAATLWGVAAAEADDVAGYPRTRGWLADTAEEFRRPIPWPPCPRPGWESLYQQMIAALTELDPAVTPQRDGVAVVEGELAVMVRSGAPHFDVWRVLSRASAASTQTCEVCGAEGAWQEEIDGNPVLCSEHLDLVEREGIR